MHFFLIFYLITKTIGEQCYLFFFFFFEILLELIEQGEQWNYKLKKKIEKKESGTVATNYIPQKMGLHSFGNSIFFAFFKQLV